MKTYQDKVVWIIGASSGFGEALARSFAACGAKLILSARRADKLKEVQNNIKDSTVVPIDMEEIDSFSLKTEEAIAAYGHIDIVVLNAGIAQKSFAQTTLSAVEQRIMKIDYFSFTELTRRILPHFIQQKAGHIVVVSGLLAQIPLPGRSSYSAAKAALLGYFGSLRAEIKSDNIDVTILIPGGMQTDLVNKALDEKGNTPSNSVQTTGCSADEAARQALKVIAKKKYQKYIGNKDKSYVMWKLCRMYPNFVINLLLKQK